MVPHVQTCIFMVLLRKKYLICLMVLPSLKSNCWWSHFGRSTFWPILLLYQEADTLVEGLQLLVSTNAEFRSQLISRRPNWLSTSSKVDERGTDRFFSAEQNQAASASATAAMPLFIEAVKSKNWSIWVFTSKAKKVLDLICVATTEAKNVECHSWRCFILVRVHPLHHHHQHKK